MDCGVNVEPNILVFEMLIVYYDRMDKRNLTLLEKLEIERRRKVAENLLRIEGNPLTEKDLARIKEMDALGLVGEDRIEFLKKTLIAEFEAEDAASVST